SYLKTGTGIVFSFLIQGDPARFGAKPPMQAWLFLATRENEKLSWIRQQYKSKQLTLAEATEKIHVFVVTTPPPVNKLRRAAWLRNLALYYKHRWYIETAFRDMNHIKPTCHARTDAAKIFCTMMRCWLYNAWQIERERRRRLRRVPASVRHGPTLREFCDTVFETSFGLSCFARA
nr:hypothetical protein [Candidatus Sigynarchaeota archaeon]